MYPLNNMICDEEAKLMNDADVAFTNKSLCQRILSQWYKSCDLKGMSLNIDYVLKIEKIHRENMKYL